MPQKVTVNVTAEDIENGKRNDPNSCPINKALRPIFPDYKRNFAISVYIDSISFRKWDTLGVNIRSIVEVSLPQEATKFVANYDAAPLAPQVAPFSFELELPDGLVPATTDGK